MNYDQYLTKVSVNNWSGSKSPLSIWCTWCSYILLIILYILTDLLSSILDVSSSISLCYDSIGLLPLFYITSIILENA